MSRQSLRRECHVFSCSKVCITIISRDMFEALPILRHPHVAASQHVSVS